MKKTYSLLLAAGLILAPTVHAADLLAAWRLASENDAQFQAARMQYEAAREALPQAKAGLLPVISAYASHAKARTEQTSTVMGLAPTASAAGTGTGAGSTTADATSGSASDAAASGSPLTGAASDGATSTRSGSRADTSLLDLATGNTSGSTGTSGTTTGTTNGSGTGTTTGTTSGTTAPSSAASGGLVPTSRTTVSDYTAKTYALQLKQPLIRMASWYHYEQAEANVAAAEAGLLVERQALALRVAGSYFDVLLARDRAASLATQREAAAGQLARAERAFQSGLGTRTDIDEARARHDLIAAQQIEAEHLIRQAERALATLTAKRWAAETLAALDAGRLPMDMPAAGELERWQEEAEANNPELVALRRQLEAAGKEVDKARAGHWPTLDLVASYNDSKSDTVTAIGNRYKTAQVGVQLNVPLYAGGAVDSQVRQARASYERVRAQMDAARRKLGQEVGKQFDGIVQGIARIRASEVAVQSSNEVVRSTEKGIAAGMRNSVDLLNARQQQHQAQIELARARYEYALAHLRLLAAAGKLDEAAIERANSWLVAARPGKA